MSREYNENRVGKIDKTEDEDVIEIDLLRLVGDMLQGAARYWLLMLVIACLSSGLVYMFQKQTYAPRYIASSTFVVNTRSALNYNDDYNKATAAQLAKTFPYIIEDDSLRLIIAEDLGLEELEKDEKITAEALSDSNLITISVASSEAQRAYAILQSVLKNYPKLANAIIGNTELNILDETGLPEEPDNPFSAKKQIAIGFLLGLLIDAAILVFYGLMKKTIRTEDDFKDILNVKCIGVVPNVRFKKRSSSKNNQLLIDNDKASYGFVEVNRNIRTRIERDAAEHDAKTYLVTSAVPSEGKSTVAANMALSLAMKGRKVILVDMDLRHPSVHEALGMKHRKVGLIDVLTDKVALDQIVVPYKNTNLIVVPGGDPVLYATTILDEKKLDTLFRVFRKNADFVIVDTPPSSLFSDAAKLIKNVDAGIFVVKQDYATVDQVVEGIDFLSDTGLRIAGCVLNGAEEGIMSGSGYGYGRYGYGGYGGYGGYDNRRKRK